VTVETITTRLDELAESISAAIESGQEPAIEELEEYGELLQSFLIEDASEFFDWAHRVYGRAA